MKLPFREAGIDMVTLKGGPGWLLCGKSTKCVGFSELDHKMIKQVLARRFL